LGSGFGEIIMRNWLQLLNVLSRIFFLDLILASTSTASNFNHSESSIS
jgi:hypothetical protein